MRSFLDELRYAFRTLRRSPAFTAVTLLTLVLGIGANSAMFSVLDAVLLEPLPYPEPERIVKLTSAYALKDLPPLSASDPEYWDFKDGVRSLEALAAYIGLSGNLTGSGEPERVKLAYTTADFFPVFKVQAAVGRVYLPADESGSGPPVAVLGDGLWRRRFAGDRGIVGRSVEVNGRSLQVIGVLPPGFDFPAGAEIWSPLGLDRAQMAPRGQRYLTLVGRVRRGTTVEQASSEIGAVARGFLTKYPTDYFPDSGWGTKARALLDEIVGGARNILLLLFATVVLVLLIACVNVANLLLARAQARSREVAIRVALGGGRAALVRHSVAEALLLTFAGGALGLLLAHWALSVFLAVNPDAIPRATALPIDGRVVLFTFGLVVATGLVLGLVPALQASRPDLQGALKEGGKGSAGGRGGFRRALAGFEVALALILLIAAGLTIESFARLRRVDPGFRPDRLLAMEISLARSQYPDDPSAGQFYDQLLGRIAAVPGVEAASAVSFLPLLGANERSGSVSSEGMSFTMGDYLPEADWRSIDHRYFSTAGIELLRGRSFGPSDAASAPPVAIVDEPLAHRLWPDRDPVGRRLKIGPPVQQNPQPWRTVVGVVREVRQVDLSGASRGTLYLPQLQVPERTTHLVVRSAASDPLAVAPAVRQAILQANRNQPVSNVEAVAKVVDRAQAASRVTMLLLGAFALLAALLAAVGIYGVVAYSVDQRTHEIGLRMALGADQGDVLRLIVRQGMAMVAAGIGCGLLAALAATRLMSSLLYGVSPRDVFVFSAVPVFLALVALVANLVPAWRASRVAPVIALRAE
ncbi:MAG TPA: ABC transporter permease [Thermoanaerobaculia bacterium]|nr:ABC transporter permease [Thermoanaerobaculia bacterium]